MIVHGCYIVQSYKTMFSFLQVFKALKLFVLSQKTAKYKFYNDLTVETRYDNMYDKDSNDEANAIRKHNILCKCNSMDMLKLKKISMKDWVTKLETKFKQKIKGNKELKQKYEKFPKITSKD